MSNWRRATAPPFGPDGTLSFSSTAADSSNLNSNNVFRRRLERALHNDQKQQVYDVQPSAAQQQQGMVRSPRSVHFTQPLAQPHAMQNTRQHVPHHQHAFYATDSVAPPQYQQYQQRQQEPNESARSAGSSQVDPESRGALDAVATAIDSARAQRDAARHVAFMRELEALGMRREAADSANEVLATHRQFQFLDNQVRAADATIHHLQSQLEAEAQHCDEELRKASALQLQKEEQWRGRLLAEQEGLASLERGIQDRDREILRLKAALAQEQEQTQSLRHQLGNRSAALEELEQRLSTTSLQKGELTGFYDKTVREYEERISVLERRGSEQVLAVQAENALQRVRLEEQVTRSTIAEESSRQALQVIHARLVLLCQRYSDRVYEREKVASDFSTALEELRAASGSALQALTEEKAESIQQAFDSARQQLEEVQQQQHQKSRGRSPPSGTGGGGDAYLSRMPFTQQQRGRSPPSTDHNDNAAVDSALDSQAGELRKQVRRLQSALDQVTDDRNRLQSRSELLSRELNLALADKANSARADRHVDAARKQLGKQVSDRVIDEAVETRHSARKMQREREQQQLQQQQSVSSPPPRVGSIAAQFQVNSVRGLAAHPDLASHTVNVSTLVFGPCGNQLVDVDSDEAAAVDPVNFPSTQFHWHKDHRFPVTVYLHPADPGVVVVHVWARVEGDMTMPRKFLGCATLQVRDILRRGPGVRVLRLHGREPSEPDAFVRSAAVGGMSSSSSGRGSSSSSNGLGFVTVDIAGPFQAVHDAPPLQNDELSPSEQQLRERQHNSNKINVISSNKRRGPAAAVLAAARSQRDDDADDDDAGSPHVVSTPHHELVVPTSVPPLGRSPKGGNAPSPDIEVWLRSVSFLVGGVDRRLFGRVTNQATGSVVLRTPTMDWDGDDGSSFWPKSDASVGLHCVSGRGDALFRFELYELNQSVASSIVASRRAYLAPSASDTDQDGGPSTGTIPYDQAQMLGSVVMAGQELIAEAQRPDARKFGGAQSTRVQLSLELSKKHQRSGRSEVTAVLELVVRLMPQ